jgi:hypothetical protein
VRRDVHGSRFAARMIDQLLARHHGRISTIPSGRFATRYARCGFAPIAPKAAPCAVWHSYRLGQLARVISFLKGLPPTRLLILDRHHPPARNIESVKGPEPSG